MCDCSRLARENFRQQRLQLNGRKRTCRCRFRSLMLGNLFRHISHEYVLSSECPRTWSLYESNRRNCLLHISHSKVWRLRMHKCLPRSDLVKNERQQLAHVNGRRAAWTRKLWSRRCVGVRHFLLQSPQVSWSCGTPSWPVNSSACLLVSFESPVSPFVCSISSSSGSDLHVFNWQPA